MALPLPVASFKTTLTKQVVDTDTDIFIDSVTDDAGNSLDGLVVGLVVNKGQTNEETIIGTVDAANSKVNTTAGVRGVDPQDGLTSRAALIPNLHDIGETIEFTAHPFLVRLVRMMNGTDQVPALLQYDSSYTPVDGKDIANKDYVDFVGSGGVISYNSIIVAGTGGEVLVAGDSVYLDTADQEWKKTDATDSAKSSGADLGIAQGAGTDGGAIDGGVLIYGDDQTQTGMTPGDTMYLSDTPGALSNSAGTIEVAVGKAVSATRLLYDAREVSIPTADEKDALVGTSGDPGSTNKYVTENDTTNAATITAATIAFVDSDPDTITDSGSGFVTAGFRAGATIVVSGSGSNDGSYTVASVIAGTITLIASDSLTAEGAGATVTITVENTNKVVRTGSGDKISGDLTNISDTDATDLTDGGETVLHGHVGTLGQNVADTYFTYPVFIGDAQWTVANGIYTVGTHGAYSLFTSNGAAWHSNSVLIGINGSSSTSLPWNNGKITILEWRAKFDGGVTGDRHMGLADAGATFAEAYNSNSEKVCFAADGGTLYAVTGTGAAGTQTDISSGITLTNWNTFRIEWESGVEARFYVNGTLETTIDTNLPSSANSSFVGFGGETNGEDLAIGGLYISQEL